MTMLQTRTSDFDGAMSTQKQAGQHGPHVLISSSSPPSLRDVLRYRYHHGTHFASVFVLEKWLSPSMFVGRATGTSELAAADSLVQKFGHGMARNRLEEHWRDYIRDSDLKWLRDTARCTTVGLPIGFFTVGPSFCKGTPFEHVSDLYTNSWQAVKRLIKRCNGYDIGMLINMHALPGGANAGDYSGTNSGRADFWVSQSYRDIYSKCIRFVIEELKDVPGVVGVEIVNEPEIGATDLYPWYEAILEEAARIDSSMPIYVSDGGDVATCALWTRSFNSVHIQGNPVVMDTHLYWWYSAIDQQKSPLEIIEAVKDSLPNLECRDTSVLSHGAAPSIVGAYCCVMSDTSWAKAELGPRKQLIRQFGSTQSDTYHSRAGGSLFWTYRMDWMDGGEWGFRQQTNDKNVVAPRSLQLSCQEVKEKIQFARSQEHIRKRMAVELYPTTENNHYGSSDEGWYFEAGWNLGFADALSFLGMRTSTQNTHSQGRLQGGDKIGMIDLWILKRLRECAHSGHYLLDYEHGLRQGIRDFYSVVDL